MSAPAAVSAALMVTCLGDLFYPDVGVRIVRLLRRLGVHVDFPSRQTCCGLPLFNSGYHAEAAQVAKRTLDVFRGAEHVVVPSGSCAWMVKHEYAGLMAHAAERAEAERLARHTWELSQFLVRVLGQQHFRSAVTGRVTYHDSCHLRRGLGEAAGPRTWSSSSSAATTSAVGSGAPSRCDSPRCPPPSWTRS
jgi:L-lactate dehydrogenase complex protein LldE